jgi:hypothetical protein
MTLRVALVLFLALPVAAGFVAGALFFALEQLK